MTVTAHIGVTAPADWVCANGHRNSGWFQRCYAACDAAVYDNDSDYTDDEVRRV